MYNVMRVCDSSLRAQPFTMVYGPAYYQEAADTKRLKSLSISDGCVENWHLRIWLLDFTQCDILGNTATQSSWIFIKVSVISTSMWRRYVFGNFWMHRLIAVLTSLYTKLKWILYGGPHLGIEDDRRREVWKWKGGEPEVLVLISYISSHL